VTEQRDYTWRDALGALADAAVVHRPAPELAVAEGFLRTHIRELEQRASAAERLERIDVLELRPDDVLVFTLRDDQPLSMADAEDMDRLVRDNLNRAFAGWPEDRKTRFLVVNGADLSVLRPAPETTQSDQTATEVRPSPGGDPVRPAWNRTLDAIAERDDQLNRRTAPEVAQSDEACAHAYRRATGVVYCTREKGHPGNHSAPGHSGNRVVWNPAEPDAFEQNEQRIAPVHLSHFRIPGQGESPCHNRGPRVGDDVMVCALVKWHDGPHMDQVAVSHAGKAGEVWE
jgi:hypothetical protein